MNKKILGSIILIIIILLNIIVPIIYADNSTISIPNTTVKPGEQLKVYVNVENIKDYTISKINLITDVYLEPVLDTADTGMISGDTIFNVPIFTIENIPGDVKTFCVLYTIPSYIANGTKIKLSYSVIDEQDQEKEKNTFEITVISEEANNQNQDKPNNETSNNQSKDTQNNTNNNVQSNNKSTRKSKPE